MALINVDVTDSVQIELLKKEYKELQMGTVACLSSGFIFLLATPFMFAAKNNYFWAFSRYASLIGSLCLGGTSIVCLKRLEEIEPQYTVIKKAETRTFINKSATSEFTLMKLFEREAGNILRPIQQVPEEAPTDTAASTAADAAAKAENMRHDHIEGAAQNPPLAEAESGEAEAATEDEEIDTREQRLKLLAQLKKNKKGKHEMIRRLWGIEQCHAQYDYYLSMLEEMLEELKRLSSES